MAWSEMQVGTKTNLANDLSPEHRTSDQIFFRLVRVPPGLKKLGRGSGHDSHHCGLSSGLVET